MQKNLDTIVKEMKSFGNLLMPYNRPKASIFDEECVNCLKSKITCVDGYEIIISYNKNDCEKYFLETLQIFGRYSPFLPFYLVCKIGKRFLGEEYLSLIESFQDTRKIYCWARISDIDGNALPEKAEVEKREYEGFNYYVLDNKYVNFY